jgi:hypothetical protein
VAAGDVRIRLAHPDELTEVQRVEREAGERFRGLGLLDHLLDHSLSLPELATHQRAGRVWAAVDPDERLVGFAVANVVDGGAHLEGARRRAGGRPAGIGSRLVDVVWVSGRRNRDSAGSPCRRSATAVERAVLRDGASGCCA